MNCTPPGLITGVSDKVTTPVTIQLGTATLSCDDAFKFTVTVNGHRSTYRYTGRDGEWYRHTFENAPVDGVPSTAVVITVDTPESERTISQANVTKFTVTSGNTVTTYKLSGSGNGWYTVATNEEILSHLYDKYSFIHCHESESSFIATHHFRCPRAKMLTRLYKEYPDFAKIYTLAEFLTRYEANEANEAK